MAPDMSGSTASNNGTTASISMDVYDARCSSAQVTAAVAFLSTYRDLTTGIIGAVTSYYLGKLSDRIGRVKIMALNGIGILVSGVVIILVVAFPTYLNYRWLFLSFVIDGLSGSFPLLMGTASSYVTDCTSDTDRVVAMGWIQSGMFAGMAAGPALSGVLSRLSAPDRPADIFIYATLCQIVALGFLTILPESLPEVEGWKDSPEPHARPASWSALSFKSRPSFNILGALFEPHRSPGEARQSRTNLVLLMAINSIMYGTAVGAMDVMMLYPQAQFQWGMTETGVFISVISIGRAFSTVVILRLLIHLLTKPRLPLSPPPTPLRHPPPSQPHAQTHLPLLRIALGADLLGYIGYGAAPTGAWFVAAGVVSSLNAFGMATAQAAMSMLVAGGQVGTLMGIVGSLQAVTRLVAPPVVNLVYAWTVALLPSGVFWGLAGAVGGAVGMSCFVRLVE
jgi:MFS family permease